MAWTKLAAGWLEGPFIGWWSENPEVKREYKHRGLVLYLLLHRPWWEYGYFPFTQAKYNEGIASEEWKWGPFVFQKIYKDIPPEKLR